MGKTKTKPTGKIFLIKVALSDWDGNIVGMPYRIIAIPDRSTLYSLAEKITESFDFNFDHAFGFYNNTKRWTNSDVGYELFTDMGESTKPKFKGVKRTKINSAFGEINQKMLFLFDYGDDWHFVLELIGIESPDKKVKYPRVVESNGEPPLQYPDYDEEDYDEDEDYDDCDEDDDDD